MNQYEVMYILDPALDDQARANLMERFQGIVTANGGMVDRVDEWGAPAGIRHQLQNRGILYPDVHHRARRASARAGA